LKKFSVSSFQLKTEIFNHEYWNFLPMSVIRHHSEPGAQSERFTLAALNSTPMLAPAADWCN
jgi:hypothetical protein